jgi:hypothetical protein
MNKSLAAPQGWFGAGMYADYLGEKRPLTLRPGALRLAAPCPAIARSDWGNRSAPA